MIDKFGRKISYLRISVTDRCNLRCRYCMPEAGVKLLRHEDILSFEEIEEVIRAAVDMGVTKVRLTGGEPLVRRGIVRLVEAIGRIEGILDFGMTTNGALLASYAQGLAGAGLHRVNISIDTTDPRRYRELTRGGDVARVLAGINAAHAVGLAPVKLNCVVAADDSAVNDEYDEDAESVRELGRATGSEVRFIRTMDFEAGRFSVVEGFGAMDNPSGGDCPRCNRLRLSSDGMIRPCLFSDASFSVRELGAVGALRLAVAEKPRAGGPCAHNWMHGIGG